MESGCRRPDSARRNLHWDTSGRPFSGRPFSHFSLFLFPDGKKILERLARETGGGFFQVSKKRPIDDIYKQIQEELRSQYNLGYTPEPASANAYFHKIALTTTRKEVVLQAREGYYPPQTHDK